MFCGILVELYVIWYWCFLKQAIAVNLHCLTLKMPWHHSHSRAQLQCQLRGGGGVEVWPHVKTLPGIWVTAGQWVATPYIAWSAGDDYRGRCYKQVWNKMSGARPNWLWPSNYPGYNQRWSNAVNQQAWNDTPAKEANLFWLCWCSGSLGLLCTIVHESPGCDFKWLTVLAGN